jgi:hypothetical protein
MRSSFAVALAAALAIAASGDTFAQGKAAAAKSSAAKSAPGPSDARARAVLSGMAQFLAGTQRFSVKVQGAYDSVQASGRKIEFAESRTVTVSRPDRLRVEGERSDGVRLTTVFSGTQITLLDAGSNVYATAPQRGGIDTAVKAFVGDLGMRLPLAVLLLSTLPEELAARVQSIEYVERTSIYGAPAHHLVARTPSIDFQIWIADGERPLPQRVVITYRLAAGQPQYRAMLSDWNVAPEVNDAMFNLTPPAGAQKVAFAAQLPRLAPTARAQRAGKSK